MSEHDVCGRVASAPWVSWRVYRTDEVARCAISDERAHTYTELEDVSAEVWDLLMQGCQPEEVAARLAGADLLPSDVTEFVEELLDLGLLAPLSNDAASSAVPEPAPQPVPLEHGPNVPLENDMMNWAIKSGFLWSCHWEITYRCNEVCVHCYNPGAAHEEGDKADREREELSTNEAREMLSRMAELGLFRLTISGGEPFLRKDLLDIVAHARTLGISVDIYTNGLNLTDKVIDQIAALWPRSISVSIYSDVPEQHDAVTRVRGSHARSLECLRKLNERGIKTAMKSVMMKTNVDRQVDLRNLAATLGAALESEGALINGQDGSSAPIRLGVTDPAQLIQMAMSPDSPFFVGDASSGYGRHVKDRDATVCGAGVSFLHIDPEGAILPCSSLPLEYGNIRTTDVRDLWRENQARQKTVRESRRNAARDLKRTDGQDLMEAWTSVRLRDYYECGKHERCAWCQKCPGKAMLEHGDPLAPSAGDCRLASARMWGARLLEAGVRPESLSELRGRFDTEATNPQRRYTREFVSEHSARQLLPILQSTAGGCGTCGKPDFCSGEAPSSVASELGLDAAAVSASVAHVLTQFEELARNHLLPLVQQASSVGKGLDRVSVETPL